MSFPSKFEEEVVEEMMEEEEEDISKDFSVGSADESYTDNTTPKPKRRSPRGKARMGRTSIRRTMTPGGSEDYLSRGTEMAKRLSIRKKAEEDKKEKISPTA